MTEPFTTSTPRSSRPPPCHETGLDLLDLLRCVLLEKSEQFNNSLSANDIEITINKIAKAPGYLPKFYESHFSHCMTSNEKDISSKSFISNSSGGHPCQSMGAIILDLTKSALLEKAAHAGRTLSTNDIEIALNKIPKALEDNPKLCQFHFRDCMATAERILSGNLHDQLSKVIDAVPKPISVGHVQTIGLNNIKSRLGNRWGKLAEKVYQISERCIKRHLDTHDTLTKTKKNEFIICFTKLSTTDALLKTQAIERDLCQIFMSNDTKNELEEFNLEAEEWEELANVNVQTVEVELTAEDLDSDDIEKELFRKMAEAANRLRSDTANILKTIAGNCKVITKPVLKLTKDRTNMALMEFDPESRASALQLMTLSADKEKVTIELDRISLLSAATYLYDKNNLLGPALIVDVSFETLNTPEHLSRYIKICETFGAEIRKKIAFNLTVPRSENISKDYILHKFKELKPFCATRSIHLQGGAGFDYTDFRPAGVSLIVFDYNDFLISIRKSLDSFRNLSRHVQKFNSCILVNHLPYDKNIQELRSHDVKLFIFRD